MPVVVLEGPPRSGKSYEAVWLHILPALKRGRAVVTDIPLLIEPINRHLGKDIDHLVYQLVPGRRPDGSLYRPFARIEDYEWAAPDDPQSGDRFWERSLETGKERPLLVIDEAHEVLGTDKSEKGGPSESMITFFGMHGHHGYDVVLVTQDHMLLNTGVRKRIEERCSFTRLAMFGMPNRYIRTRYAGVRKGMVGKNFGKYDPAIHLLYKSMTGGGAISEKRLRPIWLNWKMGLFVAFIAFAVSRVAGHEGGILPGVRDVPAAADAPISTAAPGEAAPIGASSSDINRLKIAIEHEKLSKELECLRTGSPDACRTSSASGLGGLVPGQLREVGAWSTGRPQALVAPSWQPRYPYDGYRWSVGGSMEVYGETTVFLYGHPPGGGQRHRVDPEALQDAGWTVEPLGRAGLRLAYADKASVYVTGR